MSRKDKAVIVHIGSDIDEVAYKLTGGIQKDYANSINADYIVIDKRHYNRRHFKIPLVLHESVYYNQSLIVSPNVIPTGIADNIFDYVPLGKWGLIDVSELYPSNLWHSHQESLNKILESKSINKEYINNIATSEIFVAPHYSEIILNSEDYRSWYTIEDESTWFTYNLKRTKQDIIWLNQVWCVCDFDDNFNLKYPYAKFINRSIDRNGLIRNIRSDISQHNGQINIPDYTPGDNAIVTANFEDRFYSHTRESVRKYARRIGSQLIEVTGKYSKNMHLCWPKYIAATIAKDFTKTLYLDTDVYVSDNAPNIFENTPEGCWCMMDESSVNKADHGVMDHEYNQLAERNGILHNCKWHINNAGILVIPKNGHEIYHNNEPWKLENFSDEQTLLNHSLYGRKLHQLDTSWNTMPFTRSRDPVKFYHIAGADKINKLSKFLNNNYYKVLLKFTRDNHILAERITHQLIEISHVGHLESKFGGSENTHMKYHELVYNIDKFDPDLIINIDTKPDEDSIKYNNIYINTDDNKYEKDSISIYEFIDGEFYAEVYHPNPTKHGNKYTYLDVDIPTITINYVENDDYENIVNDIISKDEYIVIILNDINRKWNANYRFDNLESYSDVIAKTDIMIDFKHRFNNHHIIYDCVNSNVPVLSLYNSRYTQQCENIIQEIESTINNNNTHKNFDLDIKYHNCLDDWKSVLKKYDSR